MGALKKVLMPHTMIKGSKKFDPIFGSGSGKKNTPAKLGAAMAKAPGPNIPGSGMDAATARFKPGMAPGGMAKPLFQPQATGADAGMGAGLGFDPAGGMPPPQFGSQEQLSGMADQLMGAGYRPQFGNRMMR